MNRRTVRNEDRQLMEEINSSTKVSANLDGVYEAITTGNVEAAKGNVPNYAGTTVGQNVNHGHETGGIPLDMQGVFLASANALGAEGTAEAMSNAYPSADGTPTTFQKTAIAQPQQPQKPGYKVSENQFNAIRKFPSVVEFLGTEVGEKIAHKIMGDMNSLIVEQIQINSSLVHDHAKQCIAKKQNIHQFFQGDGWVCQVTANGPFTGSEAFYYKEDEDKAYILRRHGSRYDDVSDQFNVIHDYNTSEEPSNNETPKSNET